MFSILNVIIIHIIIIQIILNLARLQIIGGWFIILVLYLVLETRWIWREKCFFSFTKLFRVSYLPKKQKYTIFTLPPNRDLHSPKFQALTIKSWALLIYVFKFRSQSVQKPDKTCAPEVKINEIGLNSISTKNSILIILKIFLKNTEYIFIRKF